MKVLLYLSGLDDEAWRWGMADDSKNGDSNETRQVFMAVAGFQARIRGVVWMCILVMIIIYRL
jgi:hypothetical protein